MRNEFQSFDFPLQRVPNSEKEKPEWYANCCDWIIAQGLANRNNDDLEKKYHDPLSCVKIKSTRGRVYQKNQEKVARLIENCQKKI